MDGWMDIHSFFLEVKVQKSATSWNITLYDTVFLQVSCDFAKLKLLQVNNSVLMKKADVNVFE